MSIVHNDFNVALLNHNLDEPIKKGDDDKSLKWCPKNEEWVDCERNVCIPKKCSELGYPLNCTKVDEKHCPGGCICVTGYLRNRCGKCVPIDLCRKYLYYFLERCKKIWLHMQRFP